MDRYEEALERAKAGKPMDEVFPELKESEDERIRKALVKTFEKKLEIGFEWTEFGIPNRSVLDWLEKQKEPLAPEEKMNHPLYLEGFDVGKKVGEVLEEQKPAEWSEEDEKAAYFINQFLEYHEASDPTAKSCKEWFNNRLKSLRPQPREEIYQSAKHDLAIKFMNYLDENRPEGKMNLSNGECEDIDKAFQENDWAKILRYIEKYGK